MVWSLYGDLKQSQSLLILKFKTANVSMVILHLHATFLSIALSDGSFDFSTPRPQPPPTSSSVIPFTHFIEIHYPTPLLNPGNGKTCTSILNLVVPTPQHEDHQNQTFLSEHQLLLSRDFHSLALPYHSGSEPGPHGTRSHVLITAPPGPSGSSNAVDIMSIIACYLTFAGEEETTTVVECVDAELDAFGSELANVWKGRVKGDGVEIIQKVAIAPWASTVSFNEFFFCFYLRQVAFPIK
jgi:hypothetical protein